VAPICGDVIKKVKSRGGLSFRVGHLSQVKQQFVLFENNVSEMALSDRLHKKVRYFIETLLAFKRKC